MIFKTNEELFTELMAYLEIKKIDLNERDKQYFRDVISVAYSIGYRDAGKAFGLKDYSEE